eukprot:GHVT01012935.1.p1 GENE.GHVT01012935.1~~GHVT01012935.1.p1  ORF type:complete len:138 (-),score=14.62 GHVT01012935.1:284-697(-)
MSFASGSRALLGRWLVHASARTGSIPMLGRLSSLPVYGRLAATQAAAAGQAAAPSRILGLALLRTSPPRCSGQIETYYTQVEMATRMTSPMTIHVWWFWFVLQVVIAWGSLFHSNYYFSGRFLPKPMGNTQLCEDSW